MRTCARRLAASLLLAAAALVRPAQARLVRPVIVISDLHLGEGKQDDAWSPIEDFRWEHDLKGFLDAIRARWPTGVDLVLNGDSFDLWQSSSVACGKPGDPELGCSTAQALERLQRTLIAHRNSLADLDAFARSKNYVWFVPGNHDVALLMKDVGDRLLASFTSANVHVLSSGLFISEDQSVVAEHGHMIGQDPNHLKGWPKPFQQVGDETFLNSPWGEQFVQQYYDAWERKYPIIDNITEELAGASLAIKREGLSQSLLASIDFAKFYVAGVSWPQLGGSLGPLTNGRNDTEIDWDTGKLDQAGVAALLPDGDLLRSLLSKGGLRLDAQALGAERLNLLCDRALAERSGRAGDGFPCSLKRGKLGALAEGFFRRRKQVIFERIENLRQSLTPTGGVPPAIRTYVYSHTHRAEMPFLARSSGPFQPRVVNSGAWQRVVTPEQLRHRFLVAPENALRELSPEQLPLCYSFVAIEPGKENQPQLLRYPIPSADGWRTNETQLCEKSPWR
jgi:hypothetical protein